MDSFESSILSSRLKRKSQKRKNMIVWRITALLILVAAIITGCVKLAQHVSSSKMPQDAQATQAQMLDAKIQDTINAADLLAKGYDYDAAIAKIISFGEDYTSYQPLNNAVSGYEATKATMVHHQDVTDITHVFFHTLVVDNAKAFDGDPDSKGYNQFMTTISEFNAMLEEFYARGFVLVNIYDIAAAQTQPDGTVKFVPGDIMLPAGKKPMIMSQDDVSYYPYMADDGFATKIVIGDDGYPTCEYIQDDGSVVTGDYDMVPLLEKFIQKHPDFSYKGARAILGLTGYEGVLGYRSAPKYDNHAQEAIEAKKVADVMKQKGWVFASHTWGHIPCGSSSADRLEIDSKKWQDQVAPIVGNTDILIYPHGEDIGGIGKYSGRKFDILMEKGFRYFCNVDGNTAWVQVRDTYVRQGRRNLDGYRMWHSPEKLGDLFDVEKIWDTDRPTPVAPMN